MEENNEKINDRLGATIDMGPDIQIVVILKEDVKEGKRKAINKLSSMVQQFFNDGIMEHTLVAMAEKPLLSEPKGNCHNIAVGFMADLINARQAQGWFWVKGVNENRNLEHSWLEYGDFVVDATEKQKGNPDQKTISIGERGHAYKAKGITKILRRKNAAQTRRWIFREGNKKGP